jgi:mevalonate kinase
MFDHFTAHGKLLLSAEYLLLKGSLALAIPLNKGQYMKVKPSNQDGLIWTANTLNAKWFDVTYDQNLNILKTTNKPHAEKLAQILRAAIEINPSSEQIIKNKSVTTTLEFNPQWGWGSSSTLLHLLGQWLQVDPWLLMDQTFGGSGYDIACAGTSQPIFYKRLPGEVPEITSAPFNPPFLSHLGVVWLNHKQNSSTEAKNFLNGGREDSKSIDEITAITVEMAHTDDLSHFEKLMAEHEQIITKSTGLQPIKKILFHDFAGSIKSLGAWGGDFILFASHQPFEYCEKYFQTKGYNQLFRLEEIMLNKNTSE